MVCTLKIITCKKETFSIHKCAIYMGMERKPNINSYETSTETTQELSSVVNNLFYQLQLLLLNKGEVAEHLKFVVETNNKKILQLFSDMKITSREIKKFSQVCRNMALDLKISTKYSELEYPELINDFTTVMWGTNSTDLNKLECNIVLDSKEYEITNISYKITAEKEVTDLLKVIEYIIDFGLEHRGVYFRNNTKNIIIISNYKVFDLIHNPCAGHATVLEERLKNIVFNMKILNCTLGVIPSRVNKATKLT